MTGWNSDRSFSFSPPGFFSLVVQEISKPDFIPLASSLSPNDFRGPKKGFLAMSLAKSERESPQSFKNKQGKRAELTTGN